MALPRSLALITTAAALTLAPLAIANSAEAAPASGSTAYSVSVEHCGGGIAIKAYPSKAAAKHALTKAMRYQKLHPASVHTVALRHGSKVVTISTRSC
jgi:hypothetical protein